MNYEEFLIDNNIIKKGHFFLSSGQHSDTYINKDSIFCNPYVFHKIVHKITKLTISFKYDIITGPAVAGAILAAPVSIILSNKKFVYPEKFKSNDNIDYMCFRRGYDKIIKNQKILIIEDIITTGSSVIKTMNSICNLGGSVAGIICIWNRTNWKPDNNIKIESIINKQVESWVKNECPLCSKNIPLTDPKK